MKTDEIRGAFRMVPYMGVIYVVAEAEKLGFYNGNPEWSNLGQGQPEPGIMAGAPPRLMHVNLKPEDHAYGPIHGTLEARQAVADHYNRLFRKGRKSQYKAENVAIASGGRLALTRALYALAGGNVGYQTPDYTAYEDMLGAHLHRINPVLIEAVEDDSFTIPSKRLKEEIQKNKLNAFLVSNPCNPTGTMVQGDGLAEWVKVARETKCALILDEFYSHFIYNQDGSPGKGAVTGAEYVEDVNEDPVLLIDGLTKNFRYPGWRLGWVLGPKQWIECMITAGSSLDGGPTRLAQRAMLEVLQPERADQECSAVRAEFAKKRKLMLDTLTEFGVRFTAKPLSTFYMWGCLDRLKPPYNDAFTFFRKALDYRVMTVPGEFFDVDPSRKRSGESRFKQWMRFSFGPPMGNVAQGLECLGRMLKA